ncbi:hypothetical protein CP557_21975 [Natrinema ejinorense]|uniref:Uncharacterized protein n=2 Tax=Natrinema ejinorense TaxID=373386 RepID=A0A2A5QPD7_9EURY|nr:hypothetical protein CP557_21975 [Natrinema ejinorense]
MATEGADLVVEQPSYVSEDVDRQSSNGTPVYVVKGDVQQLYPQGFDAENVSEFGLTSGSGELSYDETLERYTLDPNGETGSFEAYWIVDREQTVTEGNNTTTTTEQTRHEAVIRVDGLETVTVMEPTEVESLESNANKWTDWNGTVTDVRESSILGHRLSAPSSNEEVMQAMVNAYLTMRSPTHLLDGGFTAAVIIIATTLGGIFLFALLKVPDALALRKIYGDYFQRKSVEEQEGTLAERQESEDLKDRLNRFANWDWQDIPSVTDHEAVELREKVGETPLEGLLKFAWLFHEDTMKENRVRVMGSCGYVAQLAPETDGHVATDGGETSLGRATLVRADDVLEPDETVADRDDLRSLAVPSETLLAAIPDDDPELNDFPMDTAEFDLDDLAEPPETLSLPEMIEEFDFSEFAFEDNERIGRFMAEFAVAINNHPITDEDGHIDPARLRLEQLLQFFQAADDRFQIPLAKWYKQHFDRALEEYDRDDELQTFLEEHRSRTDG